MKPEKVKEKPISHFYFNSFISSLQTWNIFSFAIRTTFCVVVYIFVS